VQRKPERICAGSGHAVNRRRFLAETARSACGVGLAGLLLGLYGGQAKSRPATALRAPGALPEEAFLAACIRCGLCVRDCPYDTLRLAKLGEPVAAGTPYFVARDVPCEMCDDIPCVAACPTGALDPGLSDIDDARMGVAVLVGHEACLNYLGLRCDVCYRVCPAMGEAITLERLHNPRTGKHALFIPTVHSERCTGCGKCEKACVLEKAAIKVLPRRLALGELGEHYRLGWEEKERRGEFLLPDLIDLPDRVPEAKP
jgi:ferredoxin-type protein NapG